MSRLRRAAFAGLAVANLVLIQAWVLAGTSQYFSSGLPATTMYAGLLTTWVLLGAVLTWIIARADHSRLGMRLAAVTIAAALLVPIDWVLRTGPGLTFPVLVGRLGTLTILLLHLLVFTPVLFIPVVQRIIVRVIPVVVAPIMVVTLLQAFSPLWAQVAVTPLDEANEHRIPTHGVKVVWLIFDEMGEMLASGSRPDAPSLPAFERLRAESFVGLNVRSPSLRTLLAIPSMFSGRRVTSATPRGHDLVLEFEDSSRAVWSQLDSPFLRVRRAGMPTAAVGWLHSYCDALPGQFDDCAWRSYQMPPTSIVEAMRNHVQEVVNEFSWPLRLVLKPWLPTPAQAEDLRRYHADTFRFVDSHAQRMLRRDAPGLYFAHYPVPHPPGVLDIVDPRSSRTWTEFYANAILADRVLAHLRTNMEADGTWSETVLVVTSDHPWRYGKPFDSRVPLIIKLAGAPAPVRYERPLSTVLLHDLLPRLAAGEIVAPHELVAYLDGVHGETSFE